MTLDVNIKLENTVNRPAIPERKKRENILNNVRVRGVGLR